MTFSLDFRVRWGEMDFNQHMRNTAILDQCGTVRMSFFDANGFSMRDFERLGIGPVIARDELVYRRELRLLEPYAVDLQLAGMSADNLRWRLRNTFTRADGEVAATVTSDGVWLDLATRRVVPAPDALQALVEGLDRTDDYVEP